MIDSQLAKLLLNDIPINEQEGNIYVKGYTHLTYGDI